MDLTLRNRMDRIMSHYVALIDGKPGAFGAVVPDLPGCTSAGQNFDEAVTHAVEAVRLWIEDALADGEAIPSARAMEILRTGPDIADALAQGAAFARVPVLVDSGRPAKANLSLDSGLLAAIDAAAAARGVTRSAFLASAARNKIALEG